MFLIFWGDAWRVEPQTTLMGKLNDFFEFVLTSRLIGSARISKALHSHVSLVRFCEDNFGLAPLNDRAKSSDGMNDCFDFMQTPLPPPQ